MKECGDSNAEEMYLTQSVFKVVLQKSTPPQIRSNAMNDFGEFVWELDFAKRTKNNFV
jgi:hypothetical protein